MKKLLFMILTFSSILFSQSYEILFDVNNASGWYGGDDRPGNQRNVADAQSVIIDQPIILESYSVRFARGFDFAQNPTSTGHEVTLRLRLRDWSVFCGMFFFFSSRRRHTRSSTVSWVRRGV